MKYQAIVLLSGGLDSVFNLYAAHEKWPGQVMAVFFNYGQRAFQKEKQAAEHFCENLKVNLQTFDITGLFEGDASSLTNLTTEIPTTEVDIDSQQASLSSAEKVWVANRNGVFLNMAACVAEKHEAQYVVPGFNKEEAATFPDNSVEYIEKMNACLALSTRNQVQVYCFSQDMDKTEIVAQCQRLCVEIDKIWSCYYAGEKLCGQCESCQRFYRATRKGDR